MQGFVVYNHRIGKGFIEQWAVKIESIDAVFIDSDDKKIKIQSNGRLFSTHELRVPAEDVQRIADEITKKVTRAMIGETAVLVDISRMILGEMSQSPQWHNEFGSHELVTNQDLKLRIVQWNNRRELVKHGVMR